MSGDAVFTGTEILILRAAAHSHAVLVELGATMPAVAGADLEPLTFYEAVEFIHDAVKGGIRDAEHSHTQKEDAKFRLVGEIADRALEAANLYFKGSTEEIDRSELANGIFALGQAVGQVEVVFGTIGKLGDQLLEEKIEQANRTRRLNARKSIWRTDALQVYDRLAARHPTWKGVALREEALRQLTVLKLPVPPSDGAFIQAIARSKARPRSPR